VRGVSSRVAAYPQSSGFSGVLDCPPELAGLRARTTREFGIRSRLAGPWAGETAMAKLVRAIVTALAIIAGPVLASLVGPPLPTRAQYNSNFQLRGSIAFNSDFQLRGSVR
jgi:hypothetical protein